MAKKTKKQIKNPRQKQKPISNSRLQDIVIAAEGNMRDVTHELTQKVEMIEIRIRELESLADDMGSLAPLLDPLIAFFKLKKIG